MRRCESRRRRRRRREGKEGQSCGVCSTKAVAPQSGLGPALLPPSAIDGLQTRQRAYGGRTTYLAVHACFALLLRTAINLGLLGTSRCALFANDQWIFARGNHLRAINCVVVQPLDRARHSWPLLGRVSLEARVVRGVKALRVPRSVEPDGSLAECLMTWPYFACALRARPIPSCAAHRERSARQDPGACPVYAVWCC